MFNSLRNQNKTHLNRTTVHFYIELRKTLRKKNIEKIRTFTFFFFLLTILLWRLKVVFHCWKLHRSLVVISDSWNDFLWNFKVCLFFLYVFAHKAVKVSLLTQLDQSHGLLLNTECTSVTHDIFFLEQSAQSFCHVQHGITVHFFMLMYFSSLQLLLV